MKAAKIVAVIAFSLVMSALAIALISDIILFAAQIIGFIVACFVSAIVFVFGLIAMFISIIFIFGIVLLENYGFWPITWASATFKEVINDYAFDSSQIAAFVSIRVVLLLLCITGFILSIVASSLRRSAIKDGDDSGVRGVKGFAVIARIFSILGIVVAIGTLAISSIL